MATVFPTCLGDALRPRLAARVVAMLRRRGATATVARAVTCCGQPAYNAGFTADARRVARRTLRSLSRTDGDIVVPSGSCAAMMRRHWPGLFAGTAHAPGATAVAARVVELSEWLAAHDAPAGRTPSPPAAIPSPQEPANAPVAWHASCHLVRELHAGDDGPRVLAARGIEVRLPDHADLCCGFGGTFSVKLPGISTAMADDKLDALVATGASCVSACDLSCLAHLEGRARARGLPLRFAHLGEVIE